MADTKKMFDYENIKGLMKSIDECQKLMDEAKEDMRIIETAKKNIEAGKFVKLFIAEKGSNMFLCSTKLSADVSAKIMQEVYDYFAWKISMIEETGQKRTDELFDEIAKAKR